MSESNGARKLLPWLLGILSLLISTGVIAGVALGWNTSQSTLRLEDQIRGMKEEFRIIHSLQRRQIERVDDKLDTHISSNR